MIAAVALILIVLFVLLRPLLAAWLYARPRRQPPPGDSPFTHTHTHAWRNGYESVQLSNGATPGRTGWYRPSANGATIILLHDHGGSARDVLPQAEALAEAGYGVLLGDLRGHGQSEIARFDRAAAVEDVVTAAAWLLRRDDAAVRIGVLGVGLGGTLALQAASRSKYIHAVAADDPLPATLDDLPPPAGVLDLLWRTRQEYLFLSAVDRFAGAAHLPANTRALARLAGRPVWLSCATRDPQQHRARHLFDAARRPKTLYEYPPVAPDTVADPLLAFFGSALAVGDVDNATGADGEWLADASPTRTATPETELSARPIGERTVAPATAMMVAFAIVPLTMLGLIAPFQLRWGLAPPRLPVEQPLILVLGFIGLLLAGLLLREGVHLAAYYVIGRVPRGAARLAGTGAGLTPRVRCAVLLPARAYRAILLTPALLLGVVPGIVAIAIGLWLLVIWSLWMLVAAGGDLAALWAMRGLPADTPVRAHPSRPGCEVFASGEFVQNIDR